MFKLVNSLCSICDDRQLEHNRFNGTLDLFNVESTHLELVNLTANNITSVKYDDNLLNSQTVRFLSVHPLPAI